MSRLDNDGLMKMFGDWHVDTGTDRHMDDYQCVENASRYPGGKLYKPSLSLMANGQDHDGLVIEAVAGDIAAVTKLNHPLAVRIRHIFDGPTDLGLLAQNLDGLDDGHCRPLSGDRVLLV